MAISATYIQLQTRIADEIGDRSDLLGPLISTSSNSPIKRAIASAIAKWEREPFYFNEVYNNVTPLFTTVPAQEFYTTSDGAGIATAPYIMSLHALIGGDQRVPLTLRDWQYLDDIANNVSSTGQPTDWAYFGEQIRLYPIPDQAYPIRASRTQRFTALSADSDANAWTQDAFDLIRCEAQLTLGRDFLKDPALVAAMESAIYGPHGYLSALKSESFRRARSRIRSTQF
jgi:hypothetical protein